jgi:hypothetical protein
MRRSSMCSPKPTIFKEDSVIQDDTFTSLATANAFFNDNLRSFGSINSGVNGDVTLELPIALHLGERWPELPD